MRVLARVLVLVHAAGSLVLATTAARAQSNDPLPPSATPLSVPPTFFVSFAMGSGAGAVGGTTEQLEAEVDCCVVRSPLHIRTEAGSFLDANTAYSVTTRIGYPLGADLPGHVTWAPSGMIRIHRMSTAGPRFHVGLGVGFFRYPVTTFAAPLGDSEQTVTDIITTGPLLVGVGTGYVFHLAGPLRIAIDVSAIGAVAIVDEVFGNSVESGTNLDVEVTFVMVR